MVDPNVLRENPEKFKKLIANGRADGSKADVVKWLELDKKRSQLIQNADKLKSERNELSKGIQGKPNPEIVEKVKNLKIEIEKFDSEINAIESEWKRILDWVPNLPLAEVPEGRGSDENVEIKAWEPADGYLQHDKLGLAEHSGKYMPKTGVHADKEFTPKPHWEIGVDLDLMDLEAGSKTSGSRFYYLKGDGVLLVYAVFDLLFKKLLKEGFQPMIVPLLVREKALYGSSHFPGDADQVYKLDNVNLEDETNALYLIGSSEPSNFAYFMDKTLDLKENPVKIMAQTPCFRSEVGSWGKDVRGIKRTHQFDKLEMNIVMEANDEKAREMHEYLLSLNEWLMQELKIPYHVINMCLGDLGYYAAAKKYDIEFWTPSQNAYTEVMSDSITTDYQTRRLNIKYTDKEGNKKYAYTLNDTGITHRILIAILEHYQQSDGSLLVPDVLQEYVGKKKITPLS